MSSAGGPNDITSRRFGFCSHTSQNADNYVDLIKKKQIMPIVWLQGNVTLASVCGVSIFIHGI